MKNTQFLFIVLTLYLEFGTYSNFNFLKKPKTHPDGNEKCEDGSKYVCITIGGSEHGGKP